jgi:hypothetical protein
MSVKIESNGLFSEAAYGPEGMPGVGGVTGGGEVHDLAWKQALAAARDSISPQAVQPVASEDPGLAMESSALADTAVRKDHPMSWDRLSMTVASMVAWNMSVGLAEDSIADPIASAQEGLASAQEGLPVADPQSILNQDGFDSIELAIALDARPESGEVPGLPADGVPGNAEHLKHQSNPSLLLNAQDSDVGDADGNAWNKLAGGPLMANDFREGTELVHDQGGVRLESTGLREVGLLNPMDAQLGTISSVATPTIMMGMETSAVSEIPALSGLQSDPSNATVISGPVSETKLPASSANADPLRAVVAVRSTSAVSENVQMGKQRLDGIRAVLSSLDEQANVRNTVAEFLAPDRAEFRPVQGPMMTAGAVGPSMDDGGAAPVIANQVSAQPDKNIQTESNVQMASDNARTFGATEESAKAFPSGSRPALSEGLRPKVELPQKSQAAPTVEPGQTSTQINVAVVGAENAEISKDQESAVQVFEAEAEIIQAEEVPELAVQEMSHLDIDIDDPLGTVRLAMTREAEEISIRMETPAEALENYKEMEAEMAEAIAQQGLDLGDFSAEAHDFGDAEEESAGDGKSRNESDRSEAGSDEVEILE